MTNIESKTANIIGGKTARACDSCLRKRARWFCAADDAFLCQNCDSSVHSANQLAGRHERVRLETASWKTNNNKLIVKLEDHDEINSWHHGFTKKPRTPRSRRLQQKSNPVADLVPEISYEDENEEEERELMLYRVPVLDPFTADQVPFGIDDIIIKDADFVDFDVVTGIMEIPEFIPTDDIELKELNSLLGIGETLDNDCFEEENQEFEAVMDTGRESFNWDFDYSKSLIAGEDEDQRITNSDFPISNFIMREKEKRRINLKINFEAIISAWDCQGSPWTNGIKPHFNSHDCWPDFMETGNGINGENGENGGGSGNGGSCSWDKEREARVLRYREKRRKRLFAKKIRYEVRKLNAEKRPRLKGRFVKRISSFNYPAT